MKPDNDFALGKVVCPGFSMVLNIPFVSVVNNLFVMLSTFAEFIYELQEIFGQYTGVRTDGMIKPKRIEIHWSGQTTLVIHFLHNWRWMAMGLIEPEEAELDDELVQKLMRAKKVIGQASDKRSMDKGELET